MACTNKTQSTIHVGIPTTTIKEFLGRQLIDEQFRQMDGDDNNNEHNVRYIAMIGDLFPVHQCTLHVCITCTGIQLKRRIRTQLLYNLQKFLSSSGSLFILFESNLLRTRYYGSRPTCT